MSSQKQADLRSMFNITSWCLPQVSSTSTTSAVYSVSVIPAWLSDKKPDFTVVYPTHLSMDNKEALFVFDTLAKYRSVQNNQKKIDFTTHPFVPNPKDHETLIAILSLFARSLGMQVNIADAPFTYEESAHRCVCGVADLASLFWLNDTSNSTIITAKFTFTLDMDFDMITANEENIKDFVLSFIEDVSTILDCAFEYVRVFGLMEGSLNVSFGLTTPDRQYTTNLATRLRDTAARPINGTQRRVLQHTRAQDYPFEMESVITHLQIHPNNFDANHNRNYKNWSVHHCVQTRGNRPYYLPVGWYRHALQVVDKYDASNQVWLGMCNGPNEWSVAYHGTKHWFTRSIVEQGLRPGRRDAYKQEAIRMVGERANAPAIYLASHCENGSDEYAHPFAVPSSGDGQPEDYKLTFQCRLKPDTFTEHQQSADVKYLRVYDRDGVRPYGILIEKVSPDGPNETDTQGRGGILGAIRRLLS